MRALPPRAPFVESVVGEFAGARQASFGFASEPDPVLLTLDPAVLALNPAELILDPAVLAPHPCTSSLKPHPISNEPLLLKCTS